MLPTKMKIAYVGDDQEKGKFVQETLEQIVVFFSINYTAINTLKNMIYIFETSSKSLRNIIEDESITKYISIPTPTLSIYGIENYNNVHQSGLIIKENGGDLDSYRDHLINLSQNKLTDLFGNNLVNLSESNYDDEQEKVTMGVQIIASYIITYLIQ